MFFFRASLNQVTAAVLFSKANKALPLKRQIEDSIPLFSALDSWGCSPKISIHSSQLLNSDYRTKGEFMKCCKEMNRT